MRRCWTCLQDHDLDDPCPQSPAVRTTRAAGGDALFMQSNESKFGPVFTATYECEDACCGEGIVEGEDIRADGDGGWIHADDGCERMARG